MFAVVLRHGLIHDVANNVIHSFTNLLYGLGLRRELPPRWSVWPNVCRFLDLQKMLAHVRVRLTNFAVESSDFLVFVIVEVSENKLK